MVENCIKPKFMVCRSDYDLSHSSYSEGYHSTGWRNNLYSEENRRVIHAWPEEVTYDKSKLEHRKILEEYYKAQVELARSGRENHPMYIDDNELDIRPQQRQVDIATLPISQEEYLIKVCNENALNNERVNRKLMDLESRSRSSQAPQVTRLPDDPPFMKRMLTKLGAGAGIISGVTFILDILDIIDVITFFANLW